MKLKLLIPLIVAVALLSGAYHFFFSKKESGEETVQPQKVGKRIAEAERAQRREAQRQRRQRNKNVEARQEKAVPVINLETEQYRELDELQRKVLEELRDALDEQSLVRLQAVLAHMKKLGVARARENGEDETKWMHYIDKALRSAMVDALGWFGTDALPELVEFLSDPEEEVAQSAIDQFEMAVDDFSLGDYDRAEIVKRFCSLIDDSDVVDWMYMEVLNSRNSVGIDALVYMAQNGTAAVKEKFPEYIEFFTGVDFIQTVEGAQQWLVEHPDTETDEELYGRIEDN